MLPAGRPQDADRPESQRGMQADGGFVVAAPDDGDELAPIGPEVAAIKNLADTLASQGKRLVVVELPVYEAGWDEAASPGALDTTHEAMLEVEAAGGGR